MQPRGLSPQSTKGRQSQARRNDLAVLEAARTVFAEYGAAASIDAIAGRAGVGVGTLYRRYGSKTELLQHLCVLASEQTLDAAREALGTDDPWTGLSRFVRTCVQHRAGALTALAGQVAATAPMRRDARAAFELTEQLVQRAREDHSLRRDATAMDITWLIEHFSRCPPDTREPIRARLLAITLDGLHAPTPGHPGDDLPGPSPRRQHYEDRWKNPVPPARATPRTSIN